jgi:hypothetical protein
MLLAHEMTVEDRHLAVSEARTALDVFDQLGASRDADEAAALLRALGAKVARGSTRARHPDETRA